MRSAFQIVEDIRGLINSSQVLMSGEGPEAMLAEVELSRLEALAKEYAQACRRINERSAKCAELLGHGQRDQALALAKAMPDLAGEVKHVDFNELGLWLDVCEAHNLMLPDLVDVADVETVVEETYGIRHARETLLRRHRHMAIGKAPLQDRLRVLRKLCEVDEAREFWREDVRTFEEARIDEIARQAKQADKAGDLALLEELQGQLLARDWLAPPNKKLLKAVEQLIVPHREKAAMESYEQIAADLHEAHAALDEQLCLSHMAQWQQVQETTGVAPSRELAESVAPVGQWLADEKQVRHEDQAYQHACQSLEQAIDEKAPGNRLEKLAGAVLRFDRGTPEVLAARFASCMEDIRRNAKRRFALRLVAIIGSLVLLAGGISAGVIYQQQRKALGTWQGHIATALAENDLSQANRLLDQLEQEDHKLSQRPEIESLRGKYRKMSADDQTRRERFATVMAAIEQSGADHPDARALKEAESLAVTFEEKNRVQDWRDRIGRARLRAVRSQREKIDASMAELRDMHQQVIRARDTEPDRIEDLAEACLARAGQIKAMDGIRTAEAGEIRTIETFVGNAAKEARQLDQEKQWIEDSLAALPSHLQPERLAKSLKSFVSRHPEHPLASDFLAASTMVEHWQAAAAWRGIAGGWRGKALVSSSVEAGRRLQGLETYRAKHPQGPHSTAASAYAAYLQAAENALEERQLVNIDGLKQELRRDYMSGLGCIETTDGKRHYYLLSDPPTPGRINDEVVSYNMACYIGSRRPRRTNIPKGNVRDGPGDAPQKKFADLAIAQFDDFDGSGWETFYLHRAADAARAQQLDPILRALIMSSRLERARDCWPFFRAQINQMEAQLAEINRGRGNWLDPEDKAAPGKRAQAKELIEGLAIGDLIAQLEDHLATISRQSLKTYVGVGVVLGGSGEIRLGRQTADGDLFIIDRTDKDEVAFRKVGQVAAGKPSAGPDALIDCPQGTLVFARPNAASSE